MPRSFPAIVLAGVALAAAFPPDPIPWLIPLALALPCAVLAGAAPRDWMAAGLVMGAIWFHVVPRAIAPHWGRTAALVMYLWPTLALGLVFLAAGLVSRTWPPVRRVFALAFVWPACTIAIERLTLTPISLAPAWAASHEWLGIARVAGAAGFDALVLALAGGLALLALRAPRRAIAVTAISMGVLVLGRHVPAPETIGMLSVAALQPNVATRDFERAAWSLYERRRIEHRLDEMTEAAIDGGAELVVWPEGGNELANTRLPSRIAALDRLVGSSSVALLIGSRDVDETGRISNTAATWTKNGLGDVVTKANPVPFAERQLAKGVPMAVRAGKAWAGIAICFDALFSQHQRALVDAGAELLVVASDDASFADSDLAAWHLAYSQVRAIEIGRALVFVSNAGPSLATTVAGRAIDGVPLGKRGILRARVPRVSGKTLATDLTIPLALLALLAALALRGDASNQLRAALLLHRAGIAVATWIALLAIIGVSGGSTSPPRDDLSRLFQQRDQRTCGAAALAFALTFLGGEVFERDLTQHAPAADPRGYSMAELSALARARGFTADGWAATLEDLEAIGGAVAIAHLNVGHFVVVMSVSDASVVLFDPAVGSVLEVPRAELSSLYTGRALFVAPGAPGSTPSP